MSHMQCSCWVCEALRRQALRLTCSLLADKAEEAATRTLDNVREVRRTASMIAVCYNDLARI